MHKRYRVPLTLEERADLDRLISRGKGDRDWAPLAGAGDRDPVRDRDASEGRDRGVGADPAGSAATGIALRGRRWVNDLTWADLAADLVVRKATTKTGAFAAHDLKLCPLVLALLDRVPADRRVGPPIVDETAGRPFADTHAQASTTLRYSRGAVGKSRKVVELRQAHRSAKNGA